MSLENLGSNDNNKFLNMILYGAGIWLVPFVISFALYTPSGPVIGTAFFNSVMGVILVAVVTIASLNYFKTLSTNYLGETIKVGSVWLTISLVLDFAILIPFSKMAISSYVTDVAIGYLVIPVIALLCGLLLQEKSEHSTKVFSQINSARK